MATKTRMSNAIARKYFLHDCDTDHRNGQLTCFFADVPAGGWGFWVNEDGDVIIDEESSNGETPSGKIIAACVTAAQKHLKSLK